MSQEKLVVLITVLAMLVFSISLPVFLEWSNLLSLLRNISILGIFSLGMAIVLIGRGIDLSQTSVGLVASGITVFLLSHSQSFLVAICAGIASAFAMGMLNATAIAVFRIPPLFATLSSAVLFVGLGRTLVLDSMIIHLPESAQGFFILDSMFSPFPFVFICYLLLALVVHVFLTRTVPGKFIYALGTNPRTAENSGLPVRQLIYLQYGLSALLGYIAGMLMVGTAAMVDLKSSGGGMIFEILTVVILGGISLGGGKGGVKSVLAGTLLIGVLFNGMTLLDLGSQIQNMAIGMVLLSAIILDGWLGSNKNKKIQQGI